MEIQGQIHFIDDTKQINDNFSKREFVLGTDLNKEYPQYIRMEMTQSRTLILDKFQEGDNVSVSFQLKGNLDKNDQTKAYTKIEALKITKS